MGARLATGSKLCQRFSQCEAGYDPTQPVALLMIERNQTTGKPDGHSGVHGIAGAHALPRRDVSCLLRQQGVEGHKSHVWPLFQCCRKCSRQASFATHPAYGGRHLWKYEGRHDNRCREFLQSGKQGTTRVVAGLGGIEPVQKHARVNGNWALHRLPPHARQYVGAADSRRPPRSDFLA